MQLAHPQGMFLTDAAARVDQQPQQLELLVGRHRPQAAHATKKAAHATPTKAMEVASVWSDWIVLDSRSGVSRPALQVAGEWC